MCVGSKSSIAASHDAIVNNCSSGNPVNATRSQSPTDADVLAPLDDRRTANEAPRLPMCTRAPARARRETADSNAKPMPASGASSRSQHSARATRERATSATRDTRSKSANRAPAAATRHQLRGRPAAAAAARRRHPRIAHTTHEPRAQRYHRVATSRHASSPATAPHGASRCAPHKSRSSCTAHRARRRRRSSSSQHCDRQRRRHFLRADLLHVRC